MADSSRTQEGAILLSKIENSDPEYCVQLTHSPSIHIYYALKRKLAHSDEQWINKFLHLGGLDSLLDSLVQLSGRGFTNFSDSILQLDCVSCVQAVMNHDVGMSFFIEGSERVKKLILALDTSNGCFKKTVFELLTVVCVYGGKGHKFVLEGLEYFKKDKNFSSKFSFITEELKTSEAVTYKTVLLAFVNCLIDCYGDIKERQLARNEFVGLKLLDHLHLIRKEEKDAALAVQLELFDEAAHQDREELTRRHGIDFSSSSDVFNALQAKLYGSVNNTHLLHILQSLYILETSQQKSSIHWQTTADVVNFMTSLKEEELETCMKNVKNPGTNVIFEEGQVTEKCDQQRNKYHDTNPLERKDSGISMGSNRSSVGSQGKAGSSSLKKYLQRAASCRDGENKLPHINEEAQGFVKPRKPMKIVKWVKIPAHVAKRETSLWGQFDDSPGIYLDYKVLEENFKDLSAGQRYADDEIELLTSEQSLALNMFFARLEASPEEVVGYIEEMDDARLSFETLRHLDRILPSEAEISQLRLFKGERFDLGPAEQFLLMLSDLPDYHIQLKGLLFKAEFTVTFQKLNMAFQSMIQASRDVLHNHGLKDFLKYMIEAGNFLNMNQHNSNASGVRLSSWLQSEATKGGRHHQSLLHSLVEQVEKKRPDGLYFINDFPYLEQASNHSVEGLKDEVTALNMKLRKFLEQLTTADAGIKEAFDFFVEDVKQDLEQLQSKITQLKSLSNQMALYVCENQTDFDLQACFKHLHKFCAKIKTCKKDNQMYKKQREMAENRIDKLNENHMNRIFGKKADACSSFSKDGKEGLVDFLLGEVQRGNIDPKVACDINHDDTLQLSMIPLASTPMTEKQPLILRPVPYEPNLKTYADRVETIIKPQYHREKQRQTASFLPDNKSNPVDINDIMASPQIFGIKNPTNGIGGEKQKTKPERPRYLPFESRSQNVNNPPKSHRRTRSDMNQSTLTELKWQKYQDDAVTNHQEAALSKPESQYNLVSIGLEKNGRLIGSKDMDYLTRQVEKEGCEEDEKKTKRPGFFRRLSKRFSRKGSKNENIASLKPESKRFGKTQDGNCDRKDSKNQNKENSKEKGKSKAKKDFKKPEEDIWVRQTVNPLCKRDENIERSQSTESVQYPVRYLKAY